MFQIHAESRFTFNGTRYLTKDFEGGTVGRVVEIYDLDKDEQWVGYAHEISPYLGRLATLALGRFECDTIRRESDDGICGLRTDNFEAQIAPHVGSDGGLDVWIWFREDHTKTVVEDRFRTVASVKRRLGELELQGRGERVEDALCPYNQDLL